MDCMFIAPTTTWPDLRTSDRPVIDTKQQQQRSSYHNKIKMSKKDSFDHLGINICVKCFQNAKRKTRKVEEAHTLSVTKSCEMILLVVHLKTNCLIPQLDNRCWYDTDMARTKPTDRQTDKQPDANWCDMGRAGRDEARRSSLPWTMSTHSTMSNSMLNC